MNEEHLKRVRQICLSLPDVTEKISHGEPTFFARKKVFCMFANNHHKGGHIAVWIPAEPGAQATLIHSHPKTYFRPPYVGVNGWVGIELTQINDEDLAIHIQEAHRLIAPRRVLKINDSPARFASVRPVLALAHSNSCGIRG